MLRRPPRSTRTDTPFPYTTLFRSEIEVGAVGDTHQLAPLRAGEAEPVLQVDRALGVVRELLLRVLVAPHVVGPEPRSEEHTSELQSLMRISYAVFCLKKKKKDINISIYNRII